MGTRIFMLRASSSGKHRGLGRADRRGRRMKKQARDFVLDKLAQELAHIAAVTMKRDDDTAKGERIVTPTEMESGRKP
jgi:hypothetical protein